jgi:hypothetical protein
MTDGDWNNEGSPAAHGTGWPSNNSDYSFSGNTLEPNNYRYYDGLGGTLTSYTTCTKWTYYGCAEYGTRYKCLDGEFTNQNLSIYAKNNDIRLYFIFFAGTPDATAQSTLTDMAEATGGFYLRATTAAELNDAYRRIAGDLITEAGVDTTVTCDFGTMIVNNAETTDDVLDYIGDPTVVSPVKGVDFPTTEPGSTMLDKYNKTPAGVINQHLIPGSDVTTGFAFTDTGPIIINQTDYWKDNDRQLAFNIGTVNVNETWETDFRFRVVHEGNIQIFGPDSQVCFENGEAGSSCMKIPNLTLSASLNPSNIGVSEKTIVLSTPTRTNSGPVTATIPVTWTTSYDGAYPITEEVSYIHEDDPPVIFETKTLDPAFDLLTAQGAVLNMEKLPPGGYKIQVYAYTPDAEDTTLSETFTYSSQGRAFIKLE